MLGVVRRAAVPAISFLIAVGLELGGFESRGLAYALFAFGGVWALVAFVTWPPVAERIHFPWEVTVRRRAMQPGSRPPDPDQLIQFANASFIPAWHSAIRLAIDVRTAIANREEDSRMADLFQVMMDWGGKAWRTLDHRVREGGGDVDLDEALADCYFHYEQMIRYVQQIGEPLGVPSDGEETLAIWRRADDRMLDKLTDLIALPLFADSELARRRTELVKSGKPDAVRAKFATERHQPPREPKRQLILPLESRLDVDGHWRRLKVHNPNDFTARRCCVQIVDYTAAGELPDGIALPSKGFKFGWSTTNVDQPSRFIDIGPGADAFADLHQVVPDRGYFTHVSPGPEPNTYLPFWGLPEGLYSYRVNIVSEGDDGIPSHQRQIQATYSGGADLELRFVEAQD